MLKKSETVREAVGSPQVQTLPFSSAILTWELFSSSLPVAPGFWLPGRNNVSSETQSYLVNTRQPMHQTRISVWFTHIPLMKQSILSTIRTGKKAAAAQLSGMCILQTFLHSSIKCMICRHHGTQSSHKSLLCRVPFCSL